MSDESTDPASDAKPSPDATAPATPDPAEPAIASGTGQRSRSNGAEHAEGHPAKGRRSARPADREAAHLPRALQPAGGNRRSLDVSNEDAPSGTQRLELVEADHVDMHQGSIGSATARSVSVTQGALGTARAEEVTVTQGALGGARAQLVTVERGVLGGAVAGVVNIRQGFAQGIIARDVALEQAGARTVIANHVTFGRQSGAFLVIARTVDGGGRILVDWRGAIAFGAAFALLSTVLRSRIRRR